MRHANRRIVRNQWTCQNCQSVNPGQVRNCEKCGAPQSVDTKFSPTSEVVTDPTELRAANGGADIHCEYCGTRNPASAKTCSQCIADLKEGKQRKHGDIFETSEDESNQDSNGDDTSGVPPDQPVYDYSLQGEEVGIYGILGHPALRIAGGIAIIALIVYVIYNLFFNITPVPVTLTSFTWERNIPVESYEWQNHQGWSIPAGGVEISHEDRTTGYGTKTEREWERVGERKVGEYKCGEETTDLGNGYSEVEDIMCDETEDVYDWVDHEVTDYSKPTVEPYYFYKIQEWVVVGNCPASGQGNQLYWPNCPLQEGQRYGFETQTFYVNFLDEKEESHSLVSTDEGWFVSLHEGQICNANRNGFGGLNPGIDCSD